MRTRMPRAHPGVAFPPMRRMLPGYGRLPGNTRNRLNVLDIQQQERETANKVGKLVGASARGSIDVLAMRRAS